MNTSEFGRFLAKMGDLTVYANFRSAKGIRVMDMTFVSEVEGVAVTLPGKDDPGRLPKAKEGLKRAVEMEEYEAAAIFHATINEMEKPILPPPLPTINPVLEKLLNLEVDKG